MPATLRSPPKDRVLTDAELGSIVGYAAYDLPFFRFVALMIATAARPEAAGKFDPAAQFDPRLGLIDLHPVGSPRTKKRNPIVPAVEQIGSLRDVL